MLYVSRRRYAHAAFGLCLLGANATGVGCAGPSSGVRQQATTVPVRGRRPATTESGGHANAHVAVGSKPASLPVQPSAQERARAAKNARIVGEVRAILKAKHSPLPELQARPTDSREHPRAQVINDTPYRLTVWFAGPCGEKLETPAKGSAETHFCPGVYHIAAKVESPDFFPLVRENQTFDLGIDYVLKIIIRAQPQIIRRARPRLDPMPIAK